VRVAAHRRTLKNVRLHARTYDQLLFNHYRVGFVPPLLDRALFDEARGIEESAARAMCRRLAREEGIFAGTSTGLNVVGALQLARELGEGSAVVTVACDSGLKYLAGDLFDPSKDG